MIAYHQNFPVSIPEEDLEARLAPYALRSYLHESTLFVSDQNLRTEYAFSRSILDDSGAGNFKAHHGDS